MRIKYRYKYKNYPYFPELTEKIKRLCLRTQPLCGMVLGVWCGLVISIVFSASANVFMFLLCAGAIFGPILARMYRKKKLAEYDMVCKC